MNYTISMIGTSSSLTKVYTNSLMLDPKKRYKIGITGGSFPNVNPNISAALGNNVMKITEDGTTWNTITFPNGQYQINDIFSYLRTYQMNNSFIVAGTTTLDTSDDVPAIQMDFDNAIMKTNFYIHAVTGKTYMIDLGTMGSMLGFTDNQVIATTKTYIRATNIPTIEGTFYYYKINCNLVESQPSEDGKTQERVLYTDTPDVGAGYIQCLPQKSYIKWKMLDPAVRSVSRIECQITDQDGSKLDMRGQKVYLDITIQDAIL